MCRKNVERIEELCEALLEVIDDSRACNDDDECELLHCVVHDCVQKMRRVITQLQPEDPIETNPQLVETCERTDRAVN